jgi:hypothetical protein
MELTRKLEAARASTHHERGCATAAEQELDMARSALSVEQAVLGAEWMARALAEGLA